MSALSLSLVLYIKCVARSYVIYARLLRPAWLLPSVDPQACMFMASLT